MRLPGLQKDLGTALLYYGVTLMLYYAATATSGIAIGAPDMVHGGRCNILTVAGNGQSVSSDNLQDFWGAEVKSSKGVSVRFKSCYSENSLLTFD